MQCNVIGYVPHSLARVNNILFKDHLLGVRDGEGGVRRGEFFSLWVRMFVCLCVYGIYER